MNGPCGKHQHIFWLLDYRWNRAAAAASLILAVWQNLIPSGRWGFCLDMFIYVYLKVSQEHVPPLDQVLNANRLWNMSHAYLYLSLRWRALHRQFITLSHRRLCFFWLISDFPSKQRLLCLGEHLTPIRMSVCLIFVRIQLWCELKLSEVSSCRSATWSPS